MLFIEKAGGVDREIQYFGDYRGFLKYY